MYRYCKAFHASPDEYESRPFRETQWLLAIDTAHNQVMNEKN